jgi:pimeloyl-ACP methyl ester carboxylesterase
MVEITHKFVQTNGIRMHIAEAGRGPLVVLLHGFPESWYSWRHQLIALAEAGYHAVAPDQRGYGQTDSPEEISKYTQLHLVGDVVGLLDALEEKQATIVGHDWGAIIAWNAALLRPDRFSGVAGLSIPYIPRGEVSFLSIMRSILGEGFYMAYFQQPGVAEAELERDVRTTLRQLLYSGSADAPADKVAQQWVIPQGAGFLDIMLNPETLPTWLTEQDLNYYTSEFERTGFRGALNWYRTLDESWELTAAWAGTPIYTPSLYVVGARDVFLSYPGGEEMVGNIGAFLPHIKEMLLLPECGHYLQQEQPEKVNAVLIEFLKSLPSSSESDTGK